MGYKRQNIEKLENLYDINVVIKQDIKQVVDKIDVRVSKEYKDFADDNENIEEKKKKNIK